MSTLKVDSIVDGSGSGAPTAPNGLTVGTTAIPTSGALSNRNLIINGAMQVAQRGTSFSGITGGSAKYTLDRYFADIATSSSVAFTVAQSSDAPQGFNSSLGVTLTTSGATGAGDYAYLRQNIEGYNFAHLNFGTANAQTFTLSFWVKSSLTGTFGGYLGAAANARFQTFSYTVSAANTWEYKTVTVSGDTAGTWDAINGVGLQVAWSLSCGTTYLGATGAWGASLLLGATGQTNLTETTGATFQITGVQLEVGDTATPFEHRSYGDELAKCQRYYLEARKGSYPEAYHYYARANTAVVGNIPFPVTMRATPSVTLNSNGVDNRAVRVDTAALVTFSPVQSWWTKDAVAGLYDDVNTPFVSGESYGIGIKADAEL